MARAKDAILPGHHLGVRVMGSKPNDIEYALRTFKRKIKESGVFDDLKSRKEYKKPSIIKRVAKQDAIRENNRRIQQESE